MIVTQIGQLRVLTRTLDDVRMECDALEEEWMRALSAPALVAEDILAPLGDRLASIVTKLAALLGE